MDLSRSEAAKILHLCYNTVCNYDTGRRSDKNNDVEVPYIVLLACRAVENKLGPVNQREI